MDAIKALTAVVTDAMKPLAKAGGYKKQRLNYRRRRGDTTQVINMQFSHGNVVTEASCYVNVGIAFDALFRLEKQPVPDAPKEYECHFRARLEDLSAGAPPSWRVDAKTDVAAMTARLAAHLARATELLDAVDGPAAMLQRRAPEYSLFLRAQLRYVTGDLDGALADVRRGVESFPEDRGMTVEKELRLLHLTPLASR